MTFQERLNAAISAIEEGRALSVGQAANDAKVFASDVRAEMRKRGLKAPSELKALFAEKRHARPRVVYE